MADAENAEGGEGAAEAAPAKSKRPRPLIIGIFLLVAGLGIGFGIFLWLGKKSDPPAADANATAAEPGHDPHAAVEAEGVIAELGQFIVNLRAEEEGEASVQYLKCKVAVEATSSVQDRITKKTIQIRNAILLYLSNLTMADIPGSENMRKIEAGLVEQLNGVLGSGAVQKAYLTEFVVQ